jgi:hypothetical protein
MTEFQGVNEAREKNVQFHSLLSWKSGHAPCIRNDRARDDAHCTRDLLLSALLHSTILTF